MKGLTIKSSHVNYAMIMVMTTVPRPEATNVLQVCTSRDG